MLRASVLLLLALTAGCGASPLQMMREGRLDDALDATADADRDTQQRVLRAVLDDAAPVLTIEAVEDTELVRLVGGHTARVLSPHWFILRATLTSHGRVLPHASFIFEVGQDNLEVPSFAMQQTEGLLAATGERAPEGHTYSTYKSDLCEAIGFLCLALAPIALLTTHKSGEAYAPPSKEDFRRVAPHASRVAEALADRCGAPGACTRYLLLRRPRHEDAPLSLRTRVLLSRSRDVELGSSHDLDAIATAKVPPGPRLAARFPIHLPLSRVPVDLERRGSSSTRSIHFCATWTQPDVVTGGGSCLVELVPLNDGATSSFGLAPPPAPATIATPAESAAKRPWWASEDAAQPPITMAAASQDAAADTEGMACKIESTWMWRGSARVVTPAEGPWAPVKDKTAVLPLAHLAPGGALGLEVWDETHDKRELVASVSIERRGSLLVAGKIKTPRGHEPIIERITCAPYDRGAVESAVLGRWPAARDAIDVAAEEAAAFEVKLDAVGGNFPSKRFADTRAAIAEIAALVGWSDPRVAALVAAESEAVAAAGRHVREALKPLALDSKDIKIRGGLSDTPSYTMRIVSVRCGDAGPCGLEVEIRPDKGSGGAVRGLSLEMIMEDGQFERVSLPDGLTIANGEARRVVVSLAPKSSAVRPGSKPIALVHRQFFWHWVHFPP